MEPNEHIFDLETPITQEAIESTKPTMPCPHCGKIIDRVVRHGRSFALQCPECKKAIGKRQLPENFPVESRPAKSKGRLVQTSIGTVSDLTPPFKEAKTPAQILEEVCNLHNLKERFTNYVVQCAEDQMGGLHPNELMAMLRDMESGVTQKQAIYVVQDYVKKLTAEREKARQTGSNIIYPIGPFGEESSPAYVGGPFYGESAGATYAPYQSYPQRTGAGGRPVYGAQQGLSPVQVQRMIQDAMVQSREKEKLDKLSERIIQLESSLPEVIRDAVADNTPVQPVTPPDVVTTKELEQILTGEVMKTQLEVQKKHVEILETLQRETLERLKEAIEARDKDREEFLKKAEDLGHRVPVDTSDYQKDESRLLATGVHELADVIRTKSPGDWIVKIIRPEAEERVRIRGKVGESRVVDLLPDELIE